MNRDLFRYHKSVKIFGVIPIYEIQYQESNLDREEDVISEVSELPEFLETEGDNDSNSLDFWS